jgi:hypothetical protein
VELERRDDPLAAPERVRDEPLQQSRKQRMGWDGPLRVLIRMHPRRMCGEARRGCAAYLADVPDLDGALAGARREERTSRVPRHRRHRAVGRLHTQAGLCSVKSPPTPPREHPLTCMTCTNTMALGLPVNTPLHTLNEATQTFACQSQCRSWPLRDAVIRMVSSGDSDRHVSSSPSCPIQKQRHTSK